MRKALIGIVLVATACSPAVALSQSQCEKLDSEWETFKTVAQAGQDVYERTHSDDAWATWGRGTDGMSDTLDQMQRGGCFTD